MRAYVIEAPGGAEALELREVPRPQERPGWVLIRVKAFGLNRSEWFTRRGESPSVRFPASAWNRVRRRGGGRARQ